MTEAHTLSSRLASAGDRPQKRFARVQPVCQVLLTLPPAEGRDLFSKARQETLNWLGNRAGSPLPDVAWHGASFDLQEVGAQRTTAVAVDQPRLWAARLDDADKSVARRTWVTELAVGEADSGAVLFGCRLQCVAQGEHPDFEPAIPGIVRQIVRSVTATVDDRPVTEQAWRIDTEDELAALEVLLRSSERRRPVIVLSHERETNSPVFPADHLAARLLGAAHVAVLSFAAGHAMTRTLGREFSVFGGAVRTYQPGFNPDRDQPSAHPLAFRDSIKTWDDGGIDGFQRFLARSMLRQSVARRREVEHELPSFSTIRSFASQAERHRARQAHRSDAEMLELALVEIDEQTERFEKEKEEWGGTLELAEQERERALRERDEARGLTSSLQARIEHLEGLLRDAGTAEVDTFPDSLDELEGWARINLSGSVEMLNRALRGAKKSSFEVPELVFRTLLILRDRYVPMRRNGGLERKEAYEAALAELGLEETPTFATARAAQYGDTYFVQYRGRRRELDRHIKGSNARDERYGFRLYFFWDDETRQAVVGWLPSHLNTGIT